MPTKKRKNPTAKERQLAVEWEKILKSASKPLERGAKARGLSPQKKSSVLLHTPHLSPHRQSELDNVQSFGDLGGGSTPKKTEKIYTGSSVLGVATMHKSNPIPVFSDDQAQDLAKMRR